MDSFDLMKEEILIEIKERLNIDIDNYDYDVLFMDFISKSINICSVYLKRDLYFQLNHGDYYFYDYELNLLKDTFKDMAIFYIRNDDFNIAITSESYSDVFSASYDFNSINDLMANRLSKMRWF